MSTKDADDTRAHENWEENGARKDRQWSLPGKSLWSKSTLNEATSKVYSDCNVKQLSNDDTYAALSSYSKSH